MGGVDTGVNDVRARVAAGAVIIDISGRTPGAMADAGKAPRSVGLGDIGASLKLFGLWHGLEMLNNGILLDVVNLFRN